MTTWTPNTLSVPPSVSSTRATATNFTSERSNTPATMKTSLAIVVNVLDRTSRGWVLAIFFGVFVVMAYLILYVSQVPFSVARIMQLSGDHRILDLMFAYSPSRGESSLAALGDEGRRHYNYFQISDIVFPATYAMALSGLILALFRHWRIAAALALIPVVTAAFDYLENVGVFVSLRTYPDPSHAALALASTSGAVKFIGFYAALCLVVSGIIVRLASVYRSRTSGRRFG